jgi:hypothetical protein
MVSPDLSALFPPQSRTYLGELAENHLGRNDWFRKDWHVHTTGICQDEWAIGSRHWFDLDMNGSSFLCRNVSV